MNYWTERPELASSDFSSNNSGLRISELKKKTENKNQTKTPKHQTPQNTTQNILGLYSLFLQTIWSFKFKYIFVFCVNWNIISERNQTKHIETT